MVLLKEKPLNCCFDTKFKPLGLVLCSHLSKQDYNLFEQITFQKFFAHKMFEVSIQAHDLWKKIKR